MTSASAYVDQSAAELRLTVCEGVLDLRQFNLLEQARLSTLFIDVEAAIIGASHLLRFTLPDGGVINEVFACIDVVTPRHKMASYRCLADGRILLNNDRFVYRFSSEIVTGDNAISRLTDLERSITSSQKNQLGLTHDFPSKSTDKWVPKTLVMVIDEEIELRVITAHSYPNEDTIVFTETTLNAKE